MSTLTAKNSSSNEAQAFGRTLEAPVELSLEDMDLASGGILIVIAIIAVLIG
jgi:hypothetical protein